MKESQYNIWVEDEEQAYVFNGMTGGLLSMSKEESFTVKKFIEDEIQGSHSSSLELLKRMANNYMLIPNETDELALLSELYKRSRYNRSHFGLTIVTSLGCNFDCPYCFEAKYNSIMNEEVQLCILQVLDDQIHRNGIKDFSVTWFGGEPLIGKKPIVALSNSFIEKCQDHKVGYNADIVTNGYLLDENTCNDLNKLKITHAQVTLDGPPHIHDQMRPLVDGKGSFWNIVHNLHYAVTCLDVSIRVNIDSHNLDYVEELFKILSAEGLGDKLRVSPGHLVGVNDGAGSPSATYGGRCYTKREFADAEIKFMALADRYGFPVASLPAPVGTPCTAVRSNELVVGSKGELYKCWESVGNPNDICGDIRDYKKQNSRLQKWMQFDPFSNSECTTCIALPVCMGGCAHHALSLNQYENRCETFRYNYSKKILEFVRIAKRHGSIDLAPVSEISHRMDTR